MNIAAVTLAANTAVAAANPERHLLPAGTLPSGFTALAMAIDTAGNRYIAGSQAMPRYRLTRSPYDENSSLLDSELQRDFSVIKIQPDNHLAWQRNFGRDSDDSAFSIAVLLDQTIVVAGSVFGTLPSATSPAHGGSTFVRFSPTGEVLGSLQPGGGVVAIVAVPDSTDWIGTFSSSPPLIVVPSGSFGFESPGPRQALVRFSVDGVVKAAAGLNSVDLTALAIAPTGEVLAAGSASWPGLPQEAPCSGTGKACVLKFSPDLKALRGWYTFGNSEGPFLARIAASAATVYLTGINQGAPLPALAGAPYADPATGGDAFAGALDLASLAPLRFTYLGASFAFPPHPSNPPSMTLTPEGLWVTAAGVRGLSASANSWTSPNPPPHPSVARSLDGGETWQPWDQGLASPTANLFAASPASAPIFSHNAIRRRDDTAWTNLDYESHGRTAQSRAIPNYIYRLRDGFNNWRFQWSHDGGATWSSRELGRTVIPLRNALKLEVANPADDSVWVATTDKVYLLSPDRFEARPIDPVRPDSSDQIYSFAAKGNLLYAVTQFSVLVKSSDGGLTWAPANRGLPGRVSAIALDPFDPSTIYAFQQTGRTLFRSDDAGANWATVVSGLPSISALEPDPATPGALYAWYGSSQVIEDYGLLLRIEQSGAQWKTLPIPGRSFPVVQSVSVDPERPGSIYATFNNWGFAAALQFSPDLSALTSGTLLFHKLQNAPAVWDPVSASLTTTASEDQLARLGSGSGCTPRIRGSISHVHSIGGSRQRRRHMQRHCSRRKRIHHPDTEFSSLFRRSLRPAYGRLPARWRLAGNLRYTASGMRPSARADTSLAKGGGGSA